MLVTCGGGRGQSGFEQMNLWPAISKVPTHMFRSWGGACVLVKRRVMVDPLMSNGFERPVTHLQVPVFMNDLRLPVCCHMQSNHRLERVCFLLRGEDFTPQHVVPVP